MNIYYLGPVGSYSEIIARKIFATDEYALVPVGGFAEVVENVRQDGMGILGIENSCRARLIFAVNPAGSD